MRVVAALSSSRASYSYWYLRLTYVRSTVLVYDLLLVRKHRPDAPTFLFNYVVLE